MRNDACGMTMIEVIMMITIGSFIVSGIVLFSRELSVNAVNLQNRISATDIGRQEAEAVMRSAYAAVPDGTIVTVINGFRVMRQVSPVSQWVQTALDENHLGMGPGAVIITHGLRQVEIRVDEADGDFSSPLARILTFKQSHVVE